MDPKKPQRAQRRAKRAPIPDSTDEAEGEPSLVNAAASNGNATDVKRSKLSKDQVYRLGLKTKQKQAEDELANLALQNDMLMERVRKLEGENRLLAEKLEKVLERWTKTSSENEKMRELYGLVDELNSKFHTVVQQSTKNNGSKK